MSRAHPNGPLIGHRIKEVEHGQPIQESTRVFDMSELKAVARLNFHEGRLEDFKQVAAEILESVRTKDSGTLQYEIYFNEDQSECVFLEKYRDSEAMIEHNENLGALLEQMMSTGSITAQIFGGANDELRSMLKDAPIQFFSTPFTP